MKLAEQVICGASSNREWNPSNADSDALAALLLFGMIFYVIIKASVNVTIILDN